MKVEDFIAKHNMKPLGKRYIGLCPFHEEKTPSFVLYPDKEEYHCFGCGKSGSINEN